MILESIKVKNFGCFEEQEIVFSETKGLILSTGKNLEDPSLGANGTGKSTIFNAICWCLYGKTAKKKSAGKLLRRKAKGGYSVEIKFKDGTLVSRSWTPNFTKLNGIAVKQEDIDTKIGLTYDQFLLVIYFAQKDDHFFDLGPTDKLDFLSKVFNLDEWTELSKKAGAWALEAEHKVAQSDNILKGFEKQIESLEAGLVTIKGLSAAFEMNKDVEKKKLQAECDQLREEEAKWKELEESRFKDSYQKIEEFKKLQLDWVEKKDKEIKAIRAEIDALPQEEKSVDKSEAYSAKEKVEAGIQLLKQTNHELMSKAMKAQHRKSVAEEDIQKYQDQLAKGIESVGSECPTCTQTISEAHILNVGAELQQLIVAAENRVLNLDKEIESLDSERAINHAEIQALEEMQSQVFSWIRELDAEEEKLNESKSIIKSLKSKLESKLNETSPYPDSLGPRQYNKQTNSPYTSQLERLHEKKLELLINPYLIQIEAVETDLKGLLFGEAVAEKDKEVSEGEAATWKFWRERFPHIRLWMLEELVLELDLFVSQTFQRLGLLDWEIKFATEKLQKNDSVKPELNIQVFKKGIEIDPDTISGGEGQRIRLAVALGISDLVKNRNNVTFNMILLDEPSMGLSVEGRQDMVEMLHAESTDKLVILAEHMVEESSLFNQIWHWIKNTEGISHLEVA